MDLNLNSAECIKSVTNIGSTTYVNVCAHTSTVVPWGVMDWFGNSLMALIVVLIVLVFVGVALSSMISAENGH